MEIENEIEDIELREAYHKYVLGQDVWYFTHYLNVDSPSEYYDSIKKMISDKLGIHFNNIAIAGSAKTGISLSPKKNFAKFHEKSDFDIILVSRKLYYELWEAYVDMYYSQITIMEYAEVKKSIFKKFISLKEPTLKHDRIIKWVKDVDSFIKDFQLIYKINHEINYRIYDSWESVERYHHFGLTQLKSKVYNKRKSQQKILNLLNGIINYKNGNTKQ